MGKKQHSKDRLFITQKEWKEEFGGKKGVRLLDYIQGLIP